MNTYDEAFDLLNEGICLICRALALFGRIKIRIEVEQMRNLNNLARLKEPQQELDPFEAFLQSPEYQTFKKRREAEAWERE